MYGKWRGLCIVVVALIILSGCGSGNRRSDVLMMDKSGTYVAGVGEVSSGGAWEFVEILGLDKWGPTLNFHDNPALNGDPAMVLNMQGLFFKGQVVCMWPNGRFERSQAYSMLLQNCPPGSPLTSALGGGGSGDAKLVLAVYGRQPNGLAETTFNGQVLYTFLGQEGTNWRPAPPPGR